MDGAIVHFAGPVISIAGHVRQRCMWCGAAIIDEDPRNVQIALPPGKTEEQARADGDLEMPTWEVGAWIGVDGPVRWVERTRADDEALGPDAGTPERSCAKLDPGATA